jgi:hypothetical protein
MNDGIIIKDMEEKQKRARTHDETSKLKSIVGKIKALLGEHLNDADVDARNLNSELSRMTGRGSDELTAKAAVQREEALEDCVGMAHDVLSWLTDELQAKDEIEFKALADCYNNGMQDMEKRLRAEYEAKIAKLTDGDSPLSMSLKDQRTKLSRVL